MQDRLLADPWAPEPTATELLADPLIRALMRADHVDPADLGRTLRAAAVRLQASGDQPLVSRQTAQSRAWHPASILAALQARTCGCPA